jgi:predicted DNA-binding ribbon-helix-helix protein
MLIGKIAERLHDCKLNLSVGVIQSRKQNIQSGLRVCVLQKTRRGNPLLRVWRFQHAREQRN